MSSVFFFFKQKTAYEMRISDWSSDVCSSDLQESGLVCGCDFSLGYSPERINPGDKLHTVDRITKEVAGQTPEVASRMAAIYGRVKSGGIHLAPAITKVEARAVERRVGKGCVSPCLSTCPARHEKTTTKTSTLIH